ncbi:rRNA-processing protein UTP23 homolog [Teleopsis dalmanni]|uniref:rRNA-processing protein UTP23 homolog n=1 Tax=Teleopsis dalmanni TaxID=139649 RepID=UPI0018CE0833|nr:rRNA-processing protein UTP23 homolog [Teleopsis dalmanni]
MKISRLKKSHKILQYFATNFNYREPYQVLIDATFCQAALQNKIIIEEQLKKYFQTQIKLLTTQCIILEAESLGAPLTGATKIVKKFHVHKCGHEGKPVTAAECIKSMTKDSRYIVATQDRTLQDRLRKVPGRCLLYLHKATPVLEEPSNASKKYVSKKSKDLLPAKIGEKIDHMKQTQGLKSSTGKEETSKKKHKGPKNPNPLSCKKSKKQKVQTTQSVHKNDKNTKLNLSAKSKTLMKPKRKRIKIPNHVKEIVKK